MFLNNGEAFRNRVRNFPALVNCTSIDWFSEWPKDVLESVAKRFLSDNWNEGISEKWMCTACTTVPWGTATAAAKF